MRAGALLGAMLLLGGCGRPTGADRAAQAWCSAVERRDEAAAEALMSGGLRAAIARLRRADAAFRAANPGEKPPLGDGLRLTSFPDAIERCEAVRTEGDVVVLRMTPYGASDGAWEDRLHLRGGAVDDVGFAPDGVQRLRAWAAAGGM